MSTNETMLRMSRRPTHAPLGGRGLRRGAASRRGQVLLVAVFVLFGVAVLAALFIGILGAHIMQVARYTDVGALRAVAEGGLRLANDRLLYSAPGADWRPGAQAIPVGEGEVRLKVSYGPTPDDLQSRYLLVSATATLPDNPFASYTVLGRKSLLLTDYAWYITDRYELRQTAVLGVTGVEAMGRAPRDYVFRVAGPVFSNTDLAWYGPAEVQLTTSSGPVDPLSPLSDTWQQLGVLRDDRIEVAGSLKSGAMLTGAAQADNKLLDAQPLALRVLSASGSTVSNIFKPNVDIPSSPEALKYTSGFPDLRPDLTPIGNTWRVLADLPTYNAPPPGQSLYPGSYAVPRVQPPRMDAIEPDLHTNRYLTLTRDSGMWLRTGTDFVNNGAWGWGWVYKGGLYLDNSSDLQYVDRFGNHNLEALRLNWTGGYSRNTLTIPTDPNSLVGVDGREKSTTNWWDKSGRFYLPPGVEIILHGEAQALQGAQACPYIEVIRHDRRPYHPDPADPTKIKWYYWQKPNGDYIPADQAAPTPYVAQGGVCNPLFGDPTVNVRQNRAIFPFPPNGVIYAEGNVRIRGVMPPARHAAADSPYFADDYSAAAQWGRTRRYDLQVVSGGTIYIEGDLLTPSSAGLQPAGVTSTIDKAKWEVINGSRLALLARDYVCLNTTALQPRPAHLFAVGTQGELTGDSYGDSLPRYRDPKELLLPSYLHFTVPETDPVNTAVPPGFVNGTPMATTPPFVDYVYYNVRFQLPTLANLLLNDQQTGFILGHSAWYRKNGMEEGNTEPATAPPAEGKLAKVDVELRVDSPPNDYWPWAGNKRYYTFRTVEEGAADVTQAFSNHWYDETGTRAPFSTGPLPNNYLEFLVFAGKRVTATTGVTYQLTGEDLIRLTPQVYPVWNEVPLDPQWIVKPKELGYIFGPLAITPPRGKPPLPVQIEAMVYAQNGSWFVLPGPWFNEDPQDTLPDAAFGSPTALQSALAAYPGPIYHEPLNIQILFSGAISENMPAPLGDVADWTSKWAGLLNSGQPSLSYSYDPLLRSYRIQDTYRYARFPNLPLSPDLLIWGERVTGVSAAGL